MVPSTHVARPDSVRARRRAQPRAAARGRAWHRSGGRAFPAARRRRRGLRQDGDAGAPGGGADPRRRRSETDHARDLLAPRRGGARPARRAAARAAAFAGSRSRRDAGLVWHLPRHRRQAPARICAPPRARPAVHHPRPRGLGGPDELGAARGRPQRGARALSDQGDMPRHLFAGRQRPRPAWPDARQMVPLGGRARGAPARAVRVLRRNEAAPERARLRRPPDLLRPHAGRARDRRRGRGPLRSSSHRRISGHQRASGRDRAALEAAGPGPHRRRRRRAGDLFVSRRDSAQHPRFSQGLRPAGARRHPRPQLPLELRPSFPPPMR